ncbi:MAG: MATE family efflux transporter, partial [Clostridium sp.]
MSRDQNQPLGQDFTAASLLKFAFPTMVTMVFMGLYTIGDTIVVSRFVSTDALSAVNIVTPVINLIVGLGSMLAMGGGAVIGRTLGEGRGEEASREFTLLLCFGAALGSLIAGAGTLFCSEIIRGLGSGSLLFPYCQAYLSVLLLFTPAGILQVMLQNWMITAGRPGLGMALSVGSGAANVLLDLMFVGKLHMGIAGSALGTGIGYLIPTAAGAVFFLRDRGGLRFRKPSFHVRVLAESCANGCSELISQAAAAVTTFLFNRVMMELSGEDGVAAVTIMIYSQFLLTALYIGFSMGVSPVLSYHFGAQNHRQLKRMMKICLTFIVAVS